MRVLTNREISHVSGGSVTDHDYVGLRSFEAIEASSLPDQFKESPKPVDESGTYQEYVDPAGSPEAEATEGSDPGGMTSVTG
ncbi:MAG: hypothetical protein AAFQ90_03660 [Pseudomonadota bacterium]